MKNYKINPSSSVPLNIFLADDDRDDRFFFSKALKATPFHINFTTVEDGEKLMNYLMKNSSTLPDVLFLDYNMPRKNGSECLFEIKRNQQLKDLPVIIYSTHVHDNVADILYDNGAHFYIRKTDLSELKKVLLRVLILIQKRKFIRPSREQFIFSPTEV